LRRNRLWFVPLVLLVMILAAGGAAYGLLFGRKLMSPPYKMSLEALQNDPQVAERLGEPIRGTTWCPTGLLYVDDGTGSAGLFYAVSGPKGSADVQVEAQLVAGKWGLTTLSVTYDDGEKISIDVSTSGSDEDGVDDGGEAPPWNPPSGDEETAP
jgi:hypothetical protein